MKKLALLLVLLCLTGCAASKKMYAQDDMFPKSAALKKLSAAVESAVQYKNAPDDMQNAELLAFATAHNPRLLAGFEPYRLKARNVSKHSSVLLCDAEETYALIEDSGCTGELDMQYWQQPEQPPCAFTLQLEAVCK